MSDAETIEQYKRLCGMLWEALETYGDPEFYHAIAFLADPPAGNFAEDFEEEHGHPDYDRAMPGKLARMALSMAREQYPDLVITTSS